METVNATGASGVTYTYQILNHPITWHDVPANYMFASLGVGGRWTVYYIGQCDSAQCRLTNHERWEEARKLGATHILSHLSAPDEGVRKKEEQDLILSHDPPLNTHHRPGIGLKATGTGGLFGLGLGAPRKR